MRRWSKTDSFELISIDHIAITKNRIIHKNIHDFSDNAESLVILLDLLDLALKSDREFLDNRSVNEFTLDSMKTSFLNREKLP